MAGNRIFVIGQSRAVFYTIRIGAVITGKRKMKHGDIWQEVRIKCYNLPPACRKIKLILKRAGQLAGITTGTFIGIENETVLNHRILSTSTEFS